MSDAPWSPEDDQPPSTPPPPQSGGPANPPGYPPGPSGPSGQESGYQQYQQGGYPPPPPPGYGSPGGQFQYGPYPPGQPGSTGGEDKTWALVAHFGGAAAGFITGGVFGWVPPLIAMLARGPQSPALRAQVVNALNFQILWAIIAAAGYILGTCGLAIVIGGLLYLAALAAVVMEVVFGIIAGIKASNGEPYRYPGSPNWVK